MGGISEVLLGNFVSRRLNTAGTSLNIGNYYFLNTKGKYVFVFSVAFILKKKIQNNTEKNKKGKQKCCLQEGNNK